MWMEDDFYRCLKEGSEASYHRQLVDFLKQNFLIKGFQLVVVIGSFRDSEDTVMICSTVVTIYLTINF